ncbi:MAG: hypothetical protein ACI9YL_002020, partial [Luteibaculaceae bacterium]
KREIKGVQDQWHKIILPNDIFGKTEPDFSDIRIFGLTERNDTIEAPYIIRVNSEKKTRKDVAFKTLNAVHNDLGHYFTFEIPTQEPINQIKLNFKQENFDWRVTLECSQDQSEWFTLIENYRILAIKNEETNYTFTKLAFPSSKHRFYRVLIKSQDQPKLSFVTIAQNEITPGLFSNYEVQEIRTKENKHTHQNEIDVALLSPVPVSHIKISVSDTVDFFRPVTIMCLTDSFRTDKGWKYNYRTLATGALNSVELNDFEFSSTRVQQLKIRIDNRDNQPLTIDGIHPRGYVHELVTRFTEEGNYYLTYGNKEATKPRYDIARFSDKIPEKLTVLSLGEELPIVKKENPVTEPLFKNKAWLWVIMIVIMLILGLFTLKMVRSH